MPISPALADDKAEAEARVRRLTKALLDSRSRRQTIERHRNAIWALEDVKQAIVRQNPLLSRASIPRPASLRKVRKELLDEDTLLLSFFMTRDKVLLFAIDRQRAQVEVLADSPEALATMVRSFRKRYLMNPGAGVEAYKLAAQALYRKLLGGVAQRLSGKSKLVILPHGSLSALPFEALVDSTGSFLVEQHDIRYALSATLSLALRKRHRKNTETKLAFVGVGDPVYDWAAFRAGRKESSRGVSSRALELWTAADKAAERPRGLERLPGTAKEIRAIAKLFGRNQKTYLRARANEGLIKKGVLSSARFVHIASHGLMAPHYQALALTLDPTAKEDGFLTSSEIAELKLAADLVVLSACRTGNTRQRSAEPVAGLALSLRSAGANSVVLSLWSVDDDATAKLMIDFYRPLVASGTTYDASLSDAKRTMIKSNNWQHPYFWAAFILLGG